MVIKSVFWNAESQSWIAERDYSDEGKGYKEWNHWRDDPLNADGSKPEGWRSGEEKACADANGTLTESGCNC